VYIASSGAGELLAYDATGCGSATCRPLWRAAAGDFVDTTPAVAQGLVFVGSGDGDLYAFTSAGCGRATCAPVWTGFTIGAQAAMLSSPIVAGGVVYAGKNTAQVFAWKAAGCGRPRCAPRWSALTNDEIVSSSPALVNGTLYIGGGNKFDPSHGGRLYVYRLTT
jgi:outer membrane protein assembly factor BamB